MARSLPRGPPAMGKWKPPSFAQRGLVRTLAVDLLKPQRDEICAAVQGARPLALSDAAVRVIRSVGEIYTRRGFLSPSEKELSEPVDLTLEYVDCRQSKAGGKAGSWESASFIVVTSCGKWRVVVGGHGRGWRIDAAYPIVAGDCGHTAPAARSAGGAAAAKPSTWHVQEGGAEWTRLQGLGDGLLEARMELKIFLQRKCHAGLQAGVWAACRRLQRLCARDLPQLHAALEWSDGEGWWPWANRALEQVAAACDVEECRVPVQSLHFTHDSICRVYRHGPEAGSDLEALVEDLRMGRVDPLACESLVLEVVRYQGRFYSLNNRRLWALQQHQLLLTSQNAVVLASVRLLPWTARDILKRFSKAFDTNLDGEAIRCRTSQDGAPTDGVVATTLGRAVLATPIAKEAEARRETAMLKRQEQGQRRHSEPAPAGDLPAVPAHYFFGAHGSGDREETQGELTLGGETFPGWREAKVRVQQIMRLRSGGKPVPENELRLLLDVFHAHPNAAKKRVGEVTSVTVGSSEKFKNTPAFWLWRLDGTSEDISVNKCWKKFDLANKAEAKRKKKDAQRDPVMAGERFHGSLVSWHFEKVKNYGFVRVDGKVTDADGNRLLQHGQKLYLPWDGISPAHQRMKAPEWPFPEGAPLSFKISRWKANGKFVCEDARLEDHQLQQERLARDQLLAEESLSKELLGA